MVSVKVYSAAQWPRNSSSYNWNSLSISDRCMDLACGYVWLRLGLKPTYGWQAKIERNYLVIKQANNTHKTS